MGDREILLIYHGGAEAVVETEECESPYTMVFEGQSKGDRISLESVIGDLDLKLHLLDALTYQEVADGDQCSRSE